MRKIGAVAAGFVLWSVLWVGAQQTAVAASPTAFQADGSTNSVGMLLFFLAWSVAISTASGLCTMSLAKKAMGAVVALGILLLAVGVPIQIGYWDKMPLWYHLSFLGLLIPAAILGGRLLPAPQDARTQG